MSRRVVAYEWMSLDGVIQAPSAADEDRDDGFAHGGWHPRFFDDRSRQWVIDGVRQAGGFLFGRRTYDIFAAHWPHATGPEAVLAEPLNRKPKYVASRTLTEPARWAGTEVLDGDAVRAVAALKDTVGGDLHLIGSAALARTLVAENLIDEFQLMIDPVLLGSGKRLFPDDGALRCFSLAGSRATATGALLVSYRLI